MSAEKSNDFIERWLAICAVAALVVVAFETRARALCADPYPVGVDGYYYVVQARSLLESSRLLYDPTAPLGFLWLWPWAAAFGPVVGVKLGVAAGTAAAIVPAYLLGRRISGSRPAALVGAMLVATSASSQFLAGEFVKQGLGMTLALATLAALGAALDRPSWARLGGAAALLLATLLTHKSSFVLVLVAAAPAAWQHSSRRVLLGACALGVATVLLGVVVGFVGVQDLRVVHDAFTTRAEWELPALALPDFELRFGRDALIAVVLALAALATMLVPRYRGVRPRLPPLALGFVLVALLIGLPWLDVHDVQGAAFRLRASAFVPLAPLAALVLARLLPLAGDRIRVAEFAPLVCVGLCIGLGFSRPLDLEEGRSHTHPALVQSVRALAGTLPPGATLVTQDRKVAFMARWYARQPTRLHPTDAPEARAYRLMPGNWIREDLRAALAELRATPVPGVAPVRELHPFYEGGLVLMPEATFRYLMTRVSAESRAYYASWPTT